MQTRADSLYGVSRLLMYVAQWAKGGHLLDRIKRPCQPTPLSTHWTVHASPVAFGLAALCLMVYAVWPVAAVQRMAGHIPVEAHQIPAGLLESNHVVVIDNNSGKILFQKRPDDIVPIASLTKLMTAMVVLDARPDMNRIIHIDQEGAEAQQPGRPGLLAGANLPLRDVL